MPFRTVSVTFEPAGINAILNEWMNEWMNKITDIFKERIMANNKLLFGNPLMLKR